MRIESGLNKNVSNEPNLFQGGFCKGKGFAHINDIPNARIGGTISEQLDRSACADFFITAPECGNARD
jgi:hypothetical protein